MEPPPSLPSDRAHSPAANAAAPPPVDPQGLRSVFRGLRQGSPRRLVVSPMSPNSEQLVLPSIMAPAPRIAPRGARRRFGAWFSKISEPPGRRHPRVSSVLDRHWDDVRMPQRIAAHHRILGSLARAARSARSGATVR